jgi:hypothetical protein
MFSLMLDPSRLKLFVLCFHLLVVSKKAVVEEYDRRSLFPMLFECHYHLHPFAKSKKGVIDQRVEEDNRLDMFKMTANTNDLTTKFDQ